jgi:hypothetical protein
MRVGMSMSVVVMFGLFFSPELFPRQLFFPRCNHVYLGCADAAPVYPLDLQARVHVQSLNRPDKNLGRNSGVNQSAHEHVAADPGKAFEVGYTHQRPQSFIIGFSFETRQTLAKSIALL